MKAWGEALDPGSKSGIRYLGDPTAKFTEALDLSFDASAIFGGPRSKRYALVIEDGKVKHTYVEPDNTGVNGQRDCIATNRVDVLTIYLVSAADKVLG